MRTTNRSFSVLSAALILTLIGAGLSVAADSAFEKQKAALQATANAALAKQAAALKLFAADRKKLKTLYEKLRRLKRTVVSAQRTVKSSAAGLKKQQAAVKKSAAAHAKTNGASTKAKTIADAAAKTSATAKTNAGLAAQVAAVAKKAAVAAKGQANQKLAEETAKKAAESAKLAADTSAKLAAAVKPAAAKAKTAAAAAAKTRKILNAANAALKAIEQKGSKAKNRVAKSEPLVKKAEAELNALRPTVLKRQAESAKRSAEALVKQKAVESLLISKGKLVSFSDTVAPIFAQRCLACHNARTAKGRFNMESFATILKGGESGKTLDVGDASSSNLYAQIEDDSMPKDSDPLTKQEKATIKKWIDTGAKLNVGVKAVSQLAAIVPKRTQPNPPSLYRVPIPVTAIAFSPDGKRLASSGYHEVILWDPATGKILRHVTNIAERVYDLQYSPDGKTMAVAAGTPGQLGEVKLFSAADGKLLADLVSSNDSVFSVAFSPDGKRLATAGADRAIRIYDLKTRKLLVTIEDHADWVMDVAWSPDGKKIASASRDKTSKVFDMTPRKTRQFEDLLRPEKELPPSGDSLATFNGHGQPVFAVSFSPDGKSVITAGADKQIRVWGVTNAKQIRAIGGFGNEVYRLSVSKDGRIFSCSADKTARIHTLANGKLVRTFKGHSDWIYSLAFNKATGRLATGAFNGEIRIWNSKDGKGLKTFIGAPGYKPSTVSTKK